jgi:hypothetical protein
VEAPVHYFGLRSSDFCTEFKSSPITDNGPVSPGFGNYWLHSNPCVVFSHFTVYLPGDPMISLTFLHWIWPPALSLSLPHSLHCTAHLLASFCPPFTSLHLSYQAMCKTPLPTSLVIMTLTLFFSLYSSFIIYRNYNQSAKGVVSSLALA